MILNHENSKAIFWKDGEPLKKAISWSEESGSTEMIAETARMRFIKGRLLTK